MNKNFSLKFKVHDIFIIAISLLLAIGFIIGIFSYNKSLNQGNRYVHIYHQNQRLKEYEINLNKLSAPITITLSKEKYPKLIDDFVIEVDSKKGIRVKEVECYDNTCYKQGWVNVSNLPIVCIPNDVRIVITTPDDSSDIIVYGGYKNEEYSY